MSARESGLNQARHESLRLRSVPLVDEPERIVRFPVLTLLLPFGQYDFSRGTSLYGMRPSTSVMMFSRARRLSFESAPNQGAHSVSVALKCRRGTE